MVCIVCLNKDYFKKKLKDWGMTSKIGIFPQILTDQSCSLLSGKVPVKLNCNQKAA